MNEPQIEVVVVESNSIEGLLQALENTIRGGECPALGSGQCCHDVHFDVEGLPEAARAALPHEHKHLCGEDMGKSHTTSFDPEAVTCQSCRERMNA